MGGARWDSPLWFRVVGEVYINSYGSTQDMINFTWMIGKIGQSNWHLNCNIKGGGVAGGVFRLRKVGGGHSGESKYYMYKRMKSPMYIPYIVVCGSCCKALQSDMWLPVDVSEWSSFGWVIPVKCLVFGFIPLVLYVLDALEVSPSHESTFMFLELIS